MLPHVDLEDRTLVGPGIDIVRVIRLIAEKLHAGDVDSLLGVLGTIWNVYSVIAIIVSVLFFAGFVYAKIRYNELSEIEQGLLRDAEKKWAEKYEGIAPAEGRWKDIQQHLHDDNPNSWKIAIIEADIFLEQVLTDAGYVGVTIGEKLKSANSASFTTIQDAWNAHKVRNEIAHAGDGDFILTRKLAQDTLTQYERVFREFGSLNEKKPEVTNSSHGH